MAQCLLGTLTQARLSSSRISSSASRGHGEVVADGTADDFFFIRGEMEKRDVLEECLDVEEVEEDC